LAQNTWQAKQLILMRITMYTAILWHRL